MKTLICKVLQLKGILPLLLAFFLACSPIFSFGGHNDGRVKVKIGPLKFTRYWCEGHVVKYGWQYAPNTSVWSWFKLDGQIKIDISPSSACVNISRFKPYAEVNGCYSSSGWSGVCYGGVCSYGFPLQWLKYEAGNEFIGDTISPVAGVSSSEISFQTTLTNTVGGVLFTFHNFSGKMRATVNSWHGASVRIIAYNQPQEGDTTSPPFYTIPPQDVNFETGFRIEHGEPVYTGPFTSSDFIVSTQVDPGGTTVVQIEPVPGLVKTILSPGTDSTIYLKTNIGAGYGVYNPGAIYSPQFIPTLTQWGMILLAVLLLTFGSWYILKRRRGVSLPM